MALCASKGKRNNCIAVKIFRNNQQDIKGNKFKIIMKTYQVPTTKERKPIKYWAAYDGLHEVDRNNSIALLRYKHSGKKYTFKAIR